MTLEELISEGLSTGRPINRHVEVPGFSHFYARLVSRYIHGEPLWPVLDIAAIEAETKGEGTFTKLFHGLRSRHPEVHLYVESVLNTRFVEKLHDLGFEQLGNTEPPCFYLGATSTERVMSKKFCSNCEDNFYNGNNPLGVKECWCFSTARLIMRKAVPVDQSPPWNQPATLEPNCKRIKRVVFVKPNQKS